MSRRLSLLYYANDETKTMISQTKPSIKLWVRCRHYLLALFLGFQEGYLFGSLIKVNLMQIISIDRSIDRSISFSQHSLM